jgi:biopolymer transport protein ExbB
MTQLRDIVTVGKRPGMRQNRALMTRHSHRPRYRALLALTLAIGLMQPVAGLSQTSPATPSITAPTASPPVPAAPPVAAAPAPATALTLPRDLSPWGMFVAADIVVKAVMLGLVFASVLSWTIWFAKAIELMAARRKLRHAIDALAQARSWDEAAEAMTLQDGSAAAMVQATDAELRLSADALSRDGVT